MKQIKNILVTSSLFCFMLVGAAQADDMKHHQMVTFDQAVMINNTLLKEGTYRVTFDVQRSEVKFRKSSNGDVVLITPASIETMAKDAEYDAVTTSESATGTVVQKLIFEGHKEAAVLSTKNNIAQSSISENTLSKEDWNWFFDHVYSTTSDSNTTENSNMHTDQESFNENTVNDEEMYCE